MQLIMTLDLSAHESKDMIDYANRVDLYADCFSSGA